MGNKFDALTREDDTNKGEEINKNKIVNTEENKGGSTKYLATNSFGLVLQGEKQMEGVPIIKFGDHIATEVSVQECHDKVKPISIHNSPISKSSHRKGSNSREQMELLKTINILLNDSESYCANSKSPQSPNEVRHDILIHKESKVEQPW